MAILDSYSPLLTQGLLARLITTIALGYSGNWNARRLENPFHAFWSIALGEWISDLHPHTFLIPQYQIDTIEQIPGPNDSMGTITRGDANEMTPDFVIAVASLVSRATHSPIPPALFPADFNSWRDVKIAKLSALALAELKRPPPRAQASQEEFRRELFSTFSQAREQLLAQAGHAFVKYPYVDQTILIACVGEWWSWRTATRTNVISREETILDETLRDGLGNVPFPNISTPRNNTPRRPGNTRATRTTRAGPSAPVTNTPPPAGQRGRLGRPARGINTDHSISPLDKKKRVAYSLSRKKTAAEKEAADQEKMERARIQDFHRHDTLPASIQQQPGDDEQAILESSRTHWSKYLLFGTKASNQHFSILHRVLEKQIPQVPTQSNSSQPPADYDPNDKSDYEENSDSEDRLQGWNEDLVIEVSDNSDGEEMDVDLEMGDW